MKRGITPERLAQVNSFEELAVLFYEELGWPKDTWPTFEGVQDLYGIEPGANVQSVRVVQQLSADQSWGIFLVDFGDHELRRSGLRAILNQVATKERQNHSERTWAHEDILFICRSQHSKWTLGHYTGEKPATAKLRYFWWDDPYRARTAISSLQYLQWGRFSNWEESWRVTRVSDEFFKELNQRFAEIEGLWKSHANLEDRRTATQYVLNRLIFVCFLQQKGWLEYDGIRTDYLFRMYDSTEVSNPDGFEFSRKLELLYFSGLNSQNNFPGERVALVPEIGRVPFLNGGLFERTGLDKELLPNKAYTLLLGANGLLRSFNFTVEESTPLTEAVAVDPEMLGKIFEELVTQDKRHRTGSYYTPRPIVSFMCREALKGYLGGYEALVDDHDPSGIEVAEARKIREKLENIKFCDPACGSGAYLVGMLQEILALQRLLDTAAHDSRTDYERKRIIVENCLYGVDLEDFAVTIAWLRIWLALVIDHEVNPLDVPSHDVSLPNLDMKVEVGDSIASSNPQQALFQTVVNQGRQAGLDFDAADLAVQEYKLLRHDYMRAHGSEKRNLQTQIAALRQTIRTNVSVGSFHDKAFLWPLQFPEVFLSDDPSSPKGFDVVIANPPYVRQEEIVQSMGKEYKTGLVATYTETGSGTADLFVYFYDRGLQLLRPGGMFVYISSNKWFKAAYGANLRKHLAKEAKILSITDFGDLPVFKSAMAYPMIFIARKAVSNGVQEPKFTLVPSLQAPYPDIKKVISESGFKLPVGAITKDTWRLEDSVTIQRLTRMEKRCLPLGDYVKGSVFRGILTGLNKAFVIDGKTRNKLIDQDPKSAEIIKPLAVGKDIQRWTVEDKDRWIILTKIGVEMKRYPAIMAHLSQFESELRKRTDQGNHWWELRACTYYEVFDSPGIAFLAFQVGTRFAWRPGGTYVNNAVFLLGAEFDPFLLAVLNSPSGWSEIERCCPKIQNGRQLIWDQFKKVLIPTPTSGDRSVLTALVHELLEMKSSTRTDDIGRVEDQIASRVEYLYFHQVGDETYDEWRARLEAEKGTEVEDVRNLAKAGESDTVEFKSSVIWDVMQNKHSLVMRDEVLKEICAFLNADGGTILCGVGDNGEFLGLDRDIKHASNPDKLGLVITNALGDLLTPHPAELVKLKFIEVDQKTILKIDVEADATSRYESPSVKKEDQGKNLKRTHVRIHSSAKALEGQDLINWWGRRSSKSM